MKVKCYKLIFENIRVGVVRTVGKISAFQSQGPQFDPRLCQDLNWFVLPSFPPNLTQLSIPPE